MPAQDSASEHKPRIADRLAAARRGRFVGRILELELFRSALLAAEPPFVVLHIYGPGGVGKTTLLREYARVVAESGRPVVHLDGRNVEPSPSGFLFALRLALGLAESDVSPIAEAWPSSSVLLLDTYETLAPLDTWLRETFLPQLPLGSFVVIAGRNPPAPAWRTDLDWAELTRIVALRNLRPEESQTYLATHGIPDEQHADVLAFTHGHPLALALVADVLRRGDTLAGFDPQSEPDVVRVLLERLVQDVPSADHRQALNVCVLALVTTEAMLAEVLDVADVHTLFEWLRRLPFIEQGPRGLFPHDLAREVLDVDFRWRNYQDYRELVSRIFVYLQGRIGQTAGRERQRLQMEALYVIRSNPNNQPYFDWKAVDGVYAEPASAEDSGAIVEMVRAHEGEASAQIAQHWLRRQPQAFLVFRNADGERFGFMAHLALHQATPEDSAVDPAVAAALQVVQQYGPVRQAEAIMHLRFWMHREAYQAITAAINLTAMNVVAYCTTHPNLAWNFTTMADPNFWLPHFTGVNFPRVTEADFEVGGRRYGVFAHDWRIEPAAAWLRGDRSPMPFAQDQVAPAPPVQTLAPTEFAEAVRQALRDYTRPDRLAANPLMRTRLLAVTAEREASPAALQALLREAMATLAGSPRDTKFHRAVWHTYFEPAPTQERAAELLGLPFNTYRYHLANGIERVIDWLRQRERNNSGR